VAGEEKIARVRINVERTLFQSEEFLVHVPNP
jgi:hypothetical protein